ncbi:reelin domain-containing protein 1 isoform 3-T3 [Spinachia spinachia]
MWSHLGSPLRWLGVGVVLLSLAPSTLTFSSGAGHASCGEMIPGHIRSQPREAGREHVALRASVSSYLPGQLVTVTVRSSRDFMGFLLQARRVGSAKKWVGSRLGGPVLVGGSWTFAPPGTHSLRCLSQGDTLTHSDKQLKRNLSFVWRAPDAPAGDIRFYITVVQSYFLYWAGIESAVVRDGSRGRQTGSNVTGVDEGNYAQQEEEVTPLPGMQLVQS